MTTKISRASSIFLSFISIARLTKAKKMKFEVLTLPSCSGVTIYEKKVVRSFISHSTLITMKHYQAFNNNTKWTFCLAESVRVIKSPEAFFHFRLRKKQPATKSNLLLEPVNNLLCCFFTMIRNRILHYNGFTIMIHTAFRLLARLTDALHTFIQIF